MLLVEGVLVAAIGALLGVVLGIGYASLMILGLTTLWVDAIATPFLTLDLSNPLHACYRLFQRGGGVRRYHRVDRLGVA